MKNSIFNKYYKLFVASIWAVLTLSVYSQFINVCPFYESTIFAVLFLPITYPITTYPSKSLLPKALKGNRMKNLFLYFFLFTLLLAFLYACMNNGFVWLEKKEIFPVSIMFSGLARPLYVEFFGNILSAFVADLLFCAIRFFEVHYKMSQEHAKLQQAHLEDQLYLLRDQINPHLMFNVLNHIHILMKKNVNYERKSLKII